MTPARHLASPFASIAIVLALASGPRLAHAAPAGAPEATETCEVTSTRGKGPKATRVRRVFAADGHLLSARVDAPGGGADGSEFATYDAKGRLVLLESQEEVEGPAGPMPRTRTVSQLAYDARGLLVRVATERFETGFFPTKSTRAYRYDDAGALVARVDTGDLQLPIERQNTYEGGRPVRVEWREGDATSRWVAEHDAAGRIGVLRFEGCVGDRCEAGARRSFVYDAAGRVTSERLVSPARGAEEVLRTWAYDKRGRLVRRVERKGNGAASREAATLYRYDAKGRLLEEREAGKEPMRHAMRGACGAVSLVTEPPRPESVLGVHACTSSPLGFVSACFEPRAVAVPRGADERVVPSFAEARPIVHGEAGASEEHARWYPFESPELGFSARFPEAPLAANRGLQVIGWSRAKPFLALGVDVLPAAARAAEGVAGALAGVVAAEEEDECGEIEHFPLWLQSRIETVQRGKAALGLEGEYAPGLVAPERVKKLARLVSVGDRVYFAYAMYAVGDEEGRRAADYFLSTFDVHAPAGAR
jgi:hypothetical protein